MFNFDYELLLYLVMIAGLTEIFSLPLIQKTKGVFPSSKAIPIYAFIVNTIISVLFCLSFTKIIWYFSFWVGFIAWIGADSIYKALEDKLSSHGDLIKKKVGE